MKKMGMAFVLALAVTGLCQQRASAWADFKLSAGFNLSWTGGGNSFLWGLYQGGPWPGVSCDPNCATGRGFGYGGCGYGQMPCYGYAAPGAWTAPAPAPATPAAPGGSKETTAFYNYNTAYQAGYYGQGYQPVGYSTQAYQPYYGYANPGYPTANYNYPGYYNVPSYWYGGR